MSTMPVGDLVERGSERAWAVKSVDGVYRYALGRMWDPGLPVLVVVGQNPSKADHARGDMTVAKVCGFARRLTYGSVVMLNPWARIATHGDELADGVHDPVGPANDAVLHHWLSIGNLLEPPVAAWGTPKIGNWTRAAIDARLFVVRRMAAAWRCWGTTKQGGPKHPSRLAYATFLRAYP